MPAPASIVATEPIPAGPWLRLYHLALPAAGVGTALSAAAALILALQLLRLRRKGYPLGGSTRPTQKTSP